MFQIHLLDRAHQSVAADTEGESGAWLDELEFTSWACCRAGHHWENYQTNLLVASAYLLNRDVSANFIKLLGGL